MGMLSRLVNRWGTLLKPTRRHASQGKGRSRAGLSCEPLEGRLLLSCTGGMGTDNSVLMAEQQAVLDLVPDAGVTATAAQDGNWSNPGTWLGGKLPIAGDNVLIPEGLTVTVDSVQTVPLHTIRDDGLLQFSTTQNSGLLVDTLVVTPCGTLDIGTTAQPIPANVHATLTFADTGAIDTAWDPNQFSRGLISLGTVVISGAQTTPYVALAQSPHKGDTTLVLTQPPTNWQVGDQLVLTGTSPTQNQDEQLRILGIAGSQVTVSPLAYDHLAPGGLSVYVTDLTRNVVLQSQDTQDVSRRGHVMFMHSDQVSLAYAAFDGLGRTDKSTPIDDPQLDSSGQLIAGTGLNPRDRYAVNFHRTGIDPASTPILVQGCVVAGSPGWGFANHSGNVDFENNVAYNVVGAGFATEAGDEIGTFRGNLAIRSTGTGHHESGMEFRDAQEDYGYSGHGFWFQGGGVVVVNNIAVGDRDTGFMFDTDGLDQDGLGETMFLSANLQNPALAHGQPTIPVRNVPLREFTGNIAFASWSGVNVWNHLLRGDPAAQSVLSDTTVWNVSHSGVNVYNSAKVTLQNIQVLGSPALFPTWGIDGGGLERDITFENVSVTNASTGLRLPLRGTNQVMGGFLNDVTNILASSGTDPNLVDTISTNVVFGRLSPQSLGGQQQLDINVVTGRQSWDLPSYFTNQGTLYYGTQQVYAVEQAPNYVFFPSGAAVPPQLIGKTNQQLLTQFGLAIGGALAPAGATTTPRIHGLLGAPKTPPVPLKLLSPESTTKLSGYQLIYADAAGHRVVDPQLVNLHSGWNLLTRTVGRAPRSFLVYGYATPPKFTLNAGQTMIINPVDLTKHLDVYGTVTDATGTWTDRLGFDNLASLPLLHRKDGSTYVVLHSSFYDRLGGVKTDVYLELTVDPNAPIH
jgi:hypothetical protein